MRQRPTGRRSRDLMLIADERSADVAWRLAIARDSRTDSHAKPTQTKLTKATHLSVAALLTEACVYIIPRV